MKSICVFLFLCLKLLPVLSQASIQHDTDTPRNIASEYMQNIYNEETKSFNPSYNYSNLWDIDGDKKNDSIYFIGNGGVHTFYYLRLILSSSGVPKDYTFLELDMPYISEKKLLDEFGKNPAVQFVVYDFDNDGVVDLYLNFSASSIKVPDSWRMQGVTTKCVFMHFTKGKIKVSDFKFR
ncbi:MAG: hypothetical protein IPP29_10080 [Bacteroidetes bacterium]|nr:hypothetical protein [Bacteroidota bacterium]